ncbi:MAG: TSUP family transporter, partial [Thiohalobacterales bacterium]
AGAVPGPATGFLYWPAIGGIIITSVLLAPLGAWLAHYLPRRILQQVFAVLLAIVGLKLVLGA